MGSFIQGLTMGLAYVAPIGLQNLFVINAALIHHWKRALLTAFIVILFDVTLALACFFGIGAAMKQIQWLQKGILLVGSFIVIAIGIGLLRAKEKEMNTATGNLSLGKTVSTACVVTWFNPQAIIDGTMMLGAFRVTLPAAQAVSFICGVCLASCLWFMGLTVVIVQLGNRINGKVLRGINLICGGVILLYGIKLLFSFLSMLMG